MLYSEVARKAFLARKSVFLRLDERARIQRESESALGAIQEAVEFRRCVGAYMAAVLVLVMFVFGRNRRLSRVKQKPESPLSDYGWARVRSALEVTFR